MKYKLVRCYYYSEYISYKLYIQKTFLGISYYSHNSNIYVEKSEPNPLESVVRIAEEEVRDIMNRQNNEVIKGEVRI